MSFLNDMLQAAVAAKASDVHINVRALRRCSASIP